MSVPVIMDAVAVGITVLFAAVGAWRGLWKTVMGVVVFLGAMIGAALIASTLAPPLTDQAVAFAMEQVEEQLQDAIQEKIQEKMQGSGYEDMIQSQGSAEGLEDVIQSQLHDSAISFGAAIDDIQSMSDFDLASETLSLGQIPELLERFGLSQERQTALVDSIREKLENLGQSTSQGARVALEEVVRQLVAPAVRAALFGLSFLLLSFLLRLILKGVGKGLDELPGMKSLDRAGGMVLGLAESFLLLTVASWIMRTAGLTVEAPPLSETVVLRFLAEHSLVDLLPAAQTLV